MCLWKKIVPLFLTKYTKVFKDDRSHNVRNLQAFRKVLLYVYVYAHVHVYVYTRVSVYIRVYMYVFKKESTNRKAKGAKCSHQVNLWVKNIYCSL